MASWSWDVQKVVVSTEDYWLAGFCGFLFRSSPCWVCTVELFELLKSLDGLSCAYVASCAFAAKGTQATSVVAKKTCMQLVIHKLCIINPS